MFHLQNVTLCIYDKTLIEKNFVKKFSFQNLKPKCSTLSERLQRKVVS